MKYFLDIVRDTKLVFYSNLQAIWIKIWPIVNQKKIAYDCCHIPDCRSSSSLLPTATRTHVFLSSVGGVAYDSFTPPLAIRNTVQHQKRDCDVGVCVECNPRLHLPSFNWRMNEVMPSGWVITTSPLMLSYQFGRLHSQKGKDSVSMFWPLTFMRRAKIWIIYTIESTWNK